MHKKLPVVTVQIYLSPISPLRFLLNFLIFPNISLYRSIISQNPIDCASELFSEILPSAGNSATRVVLSHIQSSKPRTDPYVMIGACMAAGSPLLTANTLAVNLTMRFLRLSDPCTMMPLRNAITSGVPPPAAGGCMNCIVYNHNQ